MAANWIKKEKKNENRFGKLRYENIINVKTDTR